MNRPETISPVGRAHVWVALGLLLGVAALAASNVRAQEPVATPVTPNVPTPTTPAPATESAPPVVANPPVQSQPEVGAAEVVGPEAAVPILPPDVQIVRFQGPEGVKVEVLGPTPEPVPVGDGRGLATFGLRVGVGYRLRLSNLPNREGAEIFPVIEVVGHLHRPQGIDPAKFPIRVELSEADFEDVLRHGRLVTQVVYLEDPEQALPLHLPKDEIPVVSLTPAEDPLKVAAALGRPMAIVRIGGRMPLPSDLQGPPIFDLAPVACPFMGPVSGRCPLPCGPVRGTPPPPGRPWMPRDEFLCDGGDHGTAANFAGDGGLRGIDPRDAVIQFRTDRRPHVLPTNTVCIYAPRFAIVRGILGANENLNVQILAGAEMLQREALQVARQNPTPMTQNQAAQIGRHRARASEVEMPIGARGYSEIRVLAALDTLNRVHGHVEVRGPETKANRQKAGLLERDLRALGIKSAESAVVTGIVQGAGEKVMAWKPQELAGVEVPPDKPGMAVIKQVDADQAEPGDHVTYTIRFRNMGNVPIGSVSIVDSLLPRLEYVPGSATGPAGTVFTAGPNTAGSTELRWDLPRPLAPGAEGSVSFRARIR